MNDDYIVVQEDGKYIILNNYEFVDANGNIYVKNSDEASNETEEKVYVLDGKHYIASEDGTLKEVKIESAS